MLELWARVRSIMLTPRTEWSAVAGESDNTFAIRYVAILAAVPALARLIGSWLIGGYTPFLAALVGAVVAYALSFAVVYAVALIVDMLAPRFGAARGFSEAFRLTAYSLTPVWLAGIFLLVPGASFLVLLGLYGFYLMWTGMPLLMRAPVDKALPYVVAVAACAIAIDIVVRLALLATVSAIR